MNVRIVVITLTIGLVLCPSVNGGDRAKNVIVLIADGCSSEQVTFARWVKGEPLSLDGILVGAVKTYIADSVIADSAPATSAFSTGVRTSNKFISIGPQAKTLRGVPMPSQDLQYRPLATVLEGARLMKKATGIVATSRVTHATPAAYMAHVPRRALENDIMEQAVYQGIDVVFGGGKRHLLPEEAKGRRTDGENLLEVLKGRGYQIVGTRDEMLNVEKGTVFGMFASSHMAAEIDRPAENPLQPTLMEMTKKAVEILSLDPDGFFLLVEGSQIDWACHAHDPAHLMSDLLAFDDAVRVALDYAREDGNTLVLALSDHNTGGFTIGNDKINEGYKPLDVETLLDPIRKMRTSSRGLWKRVGDQRT
ncbi:MAG: alkaline phosphatase, partial [Pseudomonadota bacterium]